MIGRERLPALRGQVYRLGWQVGVWPLLIKCRGEWSGARPLWKSREEAAGEAVLRERACTLTVTWLGPATWSCEIAPPVTVCRAYASGCDSTLWKGKEKQEGFTRGGGNSPRNRICCLPSVPIWGRFAGCRHIHLPRAPGTAEMKPGCTLHIHGGLWLGTAESWAFILL